MINSDRHPFGWRSWYLGDCMKRWLILFLLLTLLFSGCKKSYYETYLKEQEKKQETQAQIWFYGDSADNFKQKIEFYNNYYDPDITIVEFKESEWDLTQFQTKLQAKIMSGSGPDLIYSQYEIVLTDVYKSVQAGAFQSFDDIISDWDTSKYFTQTIEACRHTDGKLYVFPLSVDMHGIVTTEENLKAYDLTLENFSDFETTLDTLLRLWEECDGSPDRVANSDMPPLYLAIPEIFDYANGCTALGTDSVNRLLQKFESVRDYQKANDRCYNSIWYVDGVPCITNTSPEYRDILSGKQILEVTSTSVAYTSPLYFDGTTVVPPTKEDLQKIVFIPLRNTKGDWMGEVDAYLLFPAQSKHRETVENLLEVLMFDTLNIASYMISPSKAHTSIDLSKYIKLNEAATPLSESGFATLADVHTFMETPMTLTAVTQLHEECELSIRTRTDKGDFELGDLKRELNLYLSE